MKEHQAMWILFLTATTLASASRLVADTEADAHHSGTDSRIRVRISEEGQVHAIPKMPKVDPFPEEFNILPKRCATGYTRAACVLDTQVAQRRNYEDYVPAEERKRMTPELCYHFCRNTSGSQYFGLSQGKLCYCTPFYFDGGTGGSGGCDMPCAGDRSKICGGRQMSEMWALHDCNNYEMMMCPPPYNPPNTEEYYSRADALPTPCFNHRKEPLSTDSATCEIHCKPGYELTRNDIRCVVRGTIQEAWPEIVGEAHCEPLSCGDPPHVDNATMIPEGSAVHFPEPVRYTCGEGFTLNGEANGPQVFQASCNVTKAPEEPGLVAEVGFDGIVACQRVMCGACPVEAGVNDSTAWSLHASPEEGDAGRVFQDTCNYECDEGFSLNQNATGPKKFQTTCEANGLFAFSLQHCMPVSCGLPDVVPHADILNSSTKEAFFPEEVLYSCAEGYTLDGAIDGEKAFQRSCKADGTFSAAPECLPVECGAPPEMENASESSATASVEGGFKYPEAATYDCKVGYTTDQQPMGGRILTIPCEAEGFMKAESREQCMPVICGRCPALNRAILETSGDLELLFEQKCEYNCASGYSVDQDANGNRTFHTSCLPDGSFFDPGRICKPVSCGAPPEELKDASLTSGTDAVHYQDVARYECIKGYSLNGEAGGPQYLETRCKADGTYAEGKANAGDEANAVCQPVSCGFPPQVMDSKYDVKVHVYNEEVTYTCDEGYTLTGTAEGSDTTVLRCGSNGTYQTTGGDAGSDGGGAVPQCKAVTCGVPEQQPQSTITGLSDGESVSFPTKVHYACEVGYTTSGEVDGPNSFETSCQADGTYSNPEECKPVLCGDAPAVEHGTSSSKGVRFSEDATYTCDTGFSTNAQIDGPKEFATACQASGMFETPAVCMRIQCGPCPGEEEDEKFGNAVAKQRTVRVFEEKCEYTCRSGYTLDATPGGGKTYESECEATGDFTPPVDSCTPVDCGAPPSVPPNTELQGGDAARSFKESAVYKCNEGYAFQGMPGGRTRYTLRCLPDGNYEEPEDGNCEAIVCGEPAVLQDSSRDDGVRVFGDEVTYTCAEGYTLDGTAEGAKEATVKCGANGKFAGEGDTFPNGRPRCQPVVCGKPEEQDQAVIRHGAANRLQVYDDAVTYRCKHGHTLDATSGGPKEFELSCQADGKFESTDSKKCLPVNCGSLPQVGNGTHSADELIFPSSMEVSCKDGFTVNGGWNGPKTFNVECRANGFHNIRQCKPVNCGGCPHQPKSDRKNFAHKTFDEKCNYECKKGYTTDGTAAGTPDFHTKCKADGKFSEAESCLPVDCGEPPSTEHGEVTNAGSSPGFVYPTSANYRCEEGYSVTGQHGGARNFNRKCQANGTYAPGKTCQPVLCGAPPGVPNSDYDAMTEHTFGGKVEYTCQEGYSHDGTPEGETKAEVTCEANGQYKRPLPVCRPVNCGRPPQRDLERRITHTAVRFPNPAIYHCQAGYTLTGEIGAPTRLERKCQANGQFETDDRCKPVDCGMPPEEPHSTRPDKEAVFPDDVLYTCDEGYTLDMQPEGSKEFNVSCNPRGFAEARTCRKITCGKCKRDRTEGKDPFANPVTPTPVRFGDECEYKCLNGYTLDQTPEGPTSFKVTCESDGEFSDVEKCGGVLCGPAPDVENATVEEAPEGDIAFPTIVTYACKEGHSLNGAVNGAKTFQRACTRRGEYSPAKQCVPTRCGAPPGIRRASFEPKGVRTFGQTVSYSCSTGYTMDGTPAGKTETEMTCGADGRYTGDELDCLPVKCDQGEEPAHTRLQNPVASRKVNYNYELRYKCERGYTTTGIVGGPQVYTRSCGEDGKLTEGAACLAISCGAAPAHDKSENDGSDNMTFDKDVTYTCKEGYSINARASGDKEYKITCNHNGLFTNGQTCRRVLCRACPRPHHVTGPLRQKFRNTNIDPASRIQAYFGDECQYHCKDGYSTDGTKDGEKGFKLTCDANGDLEEVSKPCEPISCGAPPDDVENATVEGGADVVFGDSATYTCKEGHTLNGNKNGHTTMQRQCKADGTFQTAAEMNRKCTPIVCNRPPQIKNAAWDGDDPRTFGQTMDYTCPEGTTLSGEVGGEQSFTLKCDANGRYSMAADGSDAPAACQFITCGIPPVFENAVFKPKGLEDKEIHFNDPDPFARARPSRSRRSRRRRSTPRRRGRPARLNPAKAHYDCKPGHSWNPEDDQYTIRQDNFYVFCMKDGTYTKAPGTCRNLDNCQGRDCGRHGFCEDLPEPTGVPHKDYRCVCDEGFRVTKSPDPKHRGEMAQTCTAIDDCPTGRKVCGGNAHRRPGKRGECEDGVNKYTCKCNPGYEVAPSKDLPGNETCVPKKCGDVPEVENGVLNGLPARYNKKADFETPQWRYVCKPGHTFDKKARVTSNRLWHMRCEDDGFSNKDKKCLPVECGALTVPSRGTAEPAVEKMIYGRDVTITCGRGYYAAVSPTGPSSRIASRKQTQLVKCRSNGRITSDGKYGGVKACIRRLRR